MVDTAADRTARTARWHHAVILAVVLAVTGALAVTITAEPDGPVCDTTVYEGCPGRWDFE